MKTTKIIVKPSWLSVAIIFGLGFAIGWIKNEEKHLNEKKSETKSKVDSFTEWFKKQSAEKNDGGKE